MDLARKVLLKTTDALSPVTSTANLVVRASTYHVDDDRQKSAHIGLRSLPKHYCKTQKSFSFIPFLKAHGLKLETTSREKCPSATLLMAALCLQWVLVLTIIVLGTAMLIKVRVKLRNRQMPHDEEATGFDQFSNSDSTVQLLTNSPASPRFASNNGKLWRQDLELQLAMRETTGRESMELKLSDA